MKIPKYFISQSDILVNSRQKEWLDPTRLRTNDNSRRFFLLNSQQRDRQEKKSLFRSVYMNTVFPLLKLVSLPQLVPASPEVEEV